MNTNESRSRREILGDICQNWRTKELSDKDRGELRRAADTHTLAVNESLFRLENHFAAEHQPGKYKLSREAFEALPYLAALLAGLKINAEGDHGSIAKRAGQQPGAEKAEFSRARMARLFQASELGRRLKGFRELLRILRNTADIGELADYFLHWHESKVQWRFARDYFSPGAQTALSESAGALTENAAA